MADNEGPKKVVAKDGHTYHKSATANATTAPTNEHTIKKAQTGGGIDPDLLDFITIVDYEWGLHGELPTVDYLCTEYSYKPAQVNSYYVNSTVKAALDERGIIFKPKLLEPVGLTEPKNEPFTKPKPAPKLNHLQLIAANVLLDLTDTRSDKKKLADLGIKSGTYQAWLRDPEFSGYLRHRAESLIGDIEHEAMLSLADNVRAGKMDAIKYYHELIGRYTPANHNNSGGSNVDYQNLIVRIIEIVIDEVDDPESALRISERLRGLATAGQVAGILSSNGPADLIQPEIAKAREMSPEVQKLMNHGVGYNS